MPKLRLEGGQVLVYGRGKAESPVPATPNPGPGTPDPDPNPGPGTPTPPPPTTPQAGSYSLRFDPNYSAAAPSLIAGDTRRPMTAAELVWEAAFWEAFNGWDRVSGEIFHIPSVAKSGDSYKLSRRLIAYMGSLMLYQRVTGDGRAVARAVTLWNLINATFTNTWLTISGKGPLYNWPKTNYEFIRYMYTNNTTGTDTDALEEDLFGALLSCFTWFFEANRGYSAAVNTAADQAWRRSLDWYEKWAIRYNYAKGQIQYAADLYLLKGSQIHNFCAHILHALNVGLAARARGDTAREEKYLRAYRNRLRDLKVEPYRATDPGKQAGGWLKFQGTRPPWFGGGTYGTFVYAFGTILGDGSASMSGAPHIYDHQAHGMVAQLLFEDEPAVVNGVDYRITQDDALRMANQAAYHTYGRVAPADMVTADNATKGAPGTNSMGYFYRSSVKDFQKADGTWQLNTLAGIPGSSGFRSQPDVQDVYYSMFNFNAFKNQDLVAYIKKTNDLSNAEWGSTTKNRRPEIPVSMLLAGAHGRSV